MPLAVRVVGQAGTNPGSGPTFKFNLKFKPELARAY